jgi:DNA-binding transcriptional MocR family regulator
MQPLDRHSSVPLTEQIVTALSDEITRGQLAPGARLPSIRQLADRLDVSPYTVVNAYDRLIALGRIESRQGAGFFVCQSGAIPETAPLRLGSAGEIDAMWLARRSLEPHDRLIGCGSGFLPANWLEDTLSPAFVARALRDGGDINQPTPPQGTPALREQLALKLRAQAIPADVNKLLVTFGATQAIDLICRHLLKPGDCVVVEEPGYFVLFKRLREAGVRILPLPRRPDGPDVELLEQLAREQRPRLVFTQTVLHNPTGWNTSAPVLHRLLTLAEKHDFLLVEDDVYGDLYPGEALTLAQLSGLHRVIYYSSFTKVLTPSMRLGYLCAEPSLIAGLLEQKMASVLTGSGVDEMILAQLLKSGRFRKHQARIREKLAKARTLSLETLARAGFDTSGTPAHCQFAWLELPVAVDADTLVRDAFDHGILLAPGSLFMPSGAPSAYLRFNTAFSGHAAVADYFKQRFAALSAWRAPTQTARHHTR